MMMMRFKIQRRQQSFDSQNNNDNGDHRNPFHHDVCWIFCYSTGWMVYMYSRIISLVITWLSSSLSSFPTLTLTGPASSPRTEHFENTSPWGMSSRTGVAGWSLVPLYSALGWFSPPSSSTTRPATLVVMVGVVAQSVSRFGRCVGRLVNGMSCCYQ